MKPTATNSDATELEASPFRIFLLAATSLAISTLFIKSMVTSAARTPEFVALTFPKTVPLDQWKITESHPIVPGQVASQSVSPIPTNGLSGEIVSAQQYLYHARDDDGGAQLTVSAYYAIRTDGDLKPVMAARTSQVGTATKQDATGGFYAVFSDQGQAHVTSCLNSRGPATVTSDQFSRNRLVHDTRLSRLLPWLQGKQTLPDERCLWTQLSVPLNQYASDAMAFEAVEAAWLDWADEWRLDSGSAF